MEAQKMKVSSKNIKKLDERILVVPTKILLGDNMFTGFRTMNDFDYYKNLIRKYQLFLWRSEVETKPEYKQIIPYLVFTYEDKFFLMQRKSSSSEQRLKSLYSFGIGGHIRQEDMLDDDIFVWAKREFHEEIKYDGKLEINPIGLLNDESNLVGQVHTGFVFLIKGDSCNIQIRSELKNGSLLSLSECEQYYDSMENWSQLVFNFLKKEYKKS